MKEEMRRERTNTILKILNTNYPNQVGEKVMRTLLLDNGFDCDEESIVRDLYYLQEKGLVKVDVLFNKQANVKRTLAAITVSGIDYLDNQE